MQPPSQCEQWILHTKHVNLVQKKFFVALPALTTARNTNFKETSQAWTSIHWTWSLYNTKNISRDATDDAKLKIVLPQNFEALQCNNQLILLYSTFRLSHLTILYDFLKHFWYIVFRRKRSSDGFEVINLTNPFTKIFLQLLASMRARSCGHEPTLSNIQGKSVNSKIMSDTRVEFQK